MKNTSFFFNILYRFFKNNVLKYFYKMNIKSVKNPKGGIYVIVATKVYYQTRMLNTQKHLFRVLDNNAITNLIIRSFNDGVAAMEPIGSDCVTDLSHLILGCFLEEHE